MVWIVLFVSSFDAVNLHPKVRSDVDAIMEYYEQVASRELADDFYAELTFQLSRQQSGPSRFLSASATFAAPTSIGFLSTFCFASSGMWFVFWSPDIIEDILSWASIADEPSPGLNFVVTSRCHSASEK